MKTTRLISIVPAAAVLLVFELFLGHRHDYSGHYAAGYGATLATLMLWLRTLSDQAFVRYGTVAIGPLAVAAILVGVVTEATIFRIAKFDEIDLCSQSLGAVLAAMVAVTFTHQPKAPESCFDTGLIVGIAFLGIGGCLAVA